MQLLTLLRKPIWLALPLFHFLFWHETPGANHVVFGWFLLLVLGYRHPQNLRKANVRLVLLGQLIAGLAILWHGSSIAFITHFLMVFISGVVIRQPSFQTPYLSFFQGIFNFLVLPVKLQQNLPSNIPGRRPVARMVYMSLWPLLLVVVFFLLYSSANPVLGQWSSDWFGWLGEWVSKVSWAWFVFLGLGAMLIGSFWNKYLSTDLLSSDQGKTFLEHKRTPLKRAFRITGLRQENQQWTIALASLNLLLLLVNVIDIRWIWVGFSVPDGFSLKDFVHDGTGLLIVSILLSMAVVLFFFRGNLNFFSRNQWLKRLTFFWIGQNLVLAASVFLRNLYYVDFHGLAPGRIFMVYFLVLTAIGLLTLAWKVERKHTIFWLLRSNSWAVILVLLVASMVNHNGLIAKTNLAHHKANEIHIDYYLELEPSTYPLLLDNLATIARQMEAHKSNEVRWSTMLDPNDFQQSLEVKARKFMLEYEEGGWPSHNWSDQTTYNELRKRFPKEETKEESAMLIKLPKPQNEASNAPPIRRG